MKQTGGKFDSGCSLEDVEDTPREIAREMAGINTKILDHTRQQEHHAREAAFHAQYVLKEVRKLTDLRHRLNKLS